MARPPGVACMGYKNARPGHRPFNGISARQLSDFCRDAAIRPAVSRLDRNKLGMRHPVVWSLARASLQDRRCVAPLRLLLLRVRAGGPTGTTTRATPVGAS